MEPATCDKFWAQRIAKEQAIMFNSIPTQPIIETTSSVTKRKKKFMRLVKKSTPNEPTTQS
jgi:hypothetical protein